MPDILEKIPPQSLPSEQCVLGSCLLEREAVVYAVSNLTSNDFYRQSNLEIFKGIVDLHQRKDPVDLITLGSWLRDRDKLETVGGTLYLTTIMAETPTAAGIKHYCSIVKDKAVRRSIITDLHAVMEDAYTSVDDTRAIADRFVSKLESLSFSNDDMHSKPLSILLKKNFEEQERAVETGIRPGIKSPWKAVNGIIKDLLPGDLVVLAGRSGMGKSSLLLGWALGICEQGETSLIHSIEMKDTSLSMRAALSLMTHTRRDLANIPLCQNDPSVLDDMYQSIDKLYGHKLRIDDRPNVTVQDIEDEARRVKQSYGLGCIFVDFMQIVTPIGKTGNMYKDIGAIAYGLKALGKRVGCPVIALAQLNAELERNCPRVPKVYNLAESGQIMQASDVVLSIYRPGFYGEEECRNPYNNLDYNTHKYITEIGILKQRDEEPDVKGYLYFDAPRTWFRDLTIEEWRTMPGFNHKQGGN